MEGLAAQGAQQVVEVIRAFGAGAAVALDRENRQAGLRVAGDRRAELVGGVDHVVPGLQHDEGLVAAVGERAGPGASGHPAVERRHVEHVGGRRHSGEGPVVSIPDLPVGADQEHPVGPGIGIRERRAADEHVTRELGDGADDVLGSVVDFVAVPVFTDLTEAGVLPDFVAVVLIFVIDTLLQAGRGEGDGQNGQDAAVHRNLLGGGVWDRSQTFSGEIYLLARPHWGVQARKQRFGIPFAQKMSC